MTSPVDFIATAYDYIAGRREFWELYDMAITNHLPWRSAEPDSLQTKLAARILLAEGEWTYGAIDEDEVRELVVDVLRDEALRTMTEAEGARRR